MSANVPTKTLTLAAVQGEILPEESCYQTRLRNAVYDGVNECDVKEIVQGIITRAKAGDAKAQQLFFDQILGAKVKPTQIVVNNTFASVEQGATVSRRGLKGKE